VESNNTTDYARVHLHRVAKRTPQDTEPTNKTTERTLDGRSILRMHHIEVAVGRTFYGAGHGDDERVGQHVCGVAGKEVRRWDPTRAVTLAQALTQGRHGQTGRIVSAARAAGREVAKTQAPVAHALTIDGIERLPGAVEVTCMWLDRRATVNVVVGE
jgi:hypothetical protein